MASPILARPQVGIERLHTANLRRGSNEQREAMNCKSCRKRKIKCNRLRPKCEACKVFQCPCLYDAVPKKRGPKTEVLESLLKRVDELEKKLPNEKGSSPTSTASQGQSGDRKKSSSTTTPPSINTSVKSADPLFSPISQNGSTSSDVFIDAYFLRVNDKPFHILDEPMVRQQHQQGQLPTSLRLAIYAVSARLINQPNGYTAAVRVSEEYAGQARAQVDIDEPSIEALQTLLLVHRAYYALGKGRKAYMLQSTAISMCMALDLHREAPAKARLTPAERELRRHLFWTCYLIDRFNAAGSKRPSFISDESTLLRLPSWMPHLGAPPVEGEFFSMQMNFQHHPETGQIAYGSIAMLIDIARILGSTNKYLANGGVKGDTHFPWHASSALSRIRQELDFWASGNRDLFMDVGVIAARSDSVVLLLSKLIYHVIHCLVYRPFLPVDLAELQGSGQHQSWQIEATNLCFLHANAIIETVLLAKQTASIEWPSFVGYCLATAGTVHVHGAHYGGQERGFYSMSADFLSQEMQLLSDLRYKWAGVQHQKDTLQNVYLCHSDLVKTLASNPLRFSPVFHLEDFFDRYPGRYFDGAHVTLTDITVDAPQKSHSPKQRGSGNSLLAGQVPQQAPLGDEPKADTQANLQNQHSAEARRNTADSAIALSTISPVDDEQSQFGPLATSPLAQENFNSLPTPPIISSSFSPAFPFSPIPNSLEPQAFYPLPTDAAAGGDPLLNPNASFGDGMSNPSNPFDPTLQQAAMTPGAISQTGSSANNHVAEEKDPFLALLGQLAENEYSRGGPSDLDSFLGEQSG